MPQLKRTGIERGEATLAELRDLLDRCNELAIDLGKDVKVVQQAVQEYCLCRRPMVDGGMVTCDECSEVYHAACMELPSQYANATFVCPSCEAKEAVGVLLKSAKEVLPTTVETPQLATNGDAADAGTG